MDFYNYFYLFLWFFFKAWDLPMLLTWQHRKTCDYYPKSTNRKQKSRQFNALVQVSTERQSMTLKLNLLNHKTITYSWDYLYNFDNGYLKRKLLRITDYWNQSFWGYVFHVKNTYRYLCMQWNRFNNNMLISKLNKGNVEKRIEGSVTFPNILFNLKIWTICSHSSQN